MLLTKFWFLLYLGTLMWVHLIRYHKRVIYTSTSRVISRKDGGVYIYRIYMPKQYVDYMYHLHGCAEFPDSASH